MCEYGRRTIRQSAAICKLHGAYETASLQERRVVRSARVVRTADQVAVVFDERTGKDELKAPFPAPPNLDPLARFRLKGKATFSTGNGPHRDVEMSISNIDPLRYSDTEHSDANVVARAVRGYWVEVLDDAGDRLIHVHLVAGPPAHRQQFWFQDLYIDKSTDLPIRVNWADDDSTMTADYETVQGSWLLIPQR